MNLDMGVVSNLLSVISICVIMSSNLREIQSQQCVVLNFPTSSTCGTIKRQNTLMTNKSSNATLDQTNFPVSRNSKTKNLSEIFIDI